MTKPAIQLFIKAFMIGALVTLGLRYVADTPIQAGENAIPQFEHQSSAQADP